MVKVKYLTKRHGSSFYYYVRNIRPEHRHLFDGKKQIWKSLRTDNLSDAIRAAMKFNAVFDKRIASPLLSLADSHSASSPSAYYDKLLPSAIDPTEMSEYLEGLDDIRISRELAIDMKNRTRREVKEKLEDDIYRHERSLMTLLEEQSGALSDLEKQMAKANVLGMRALSEIASRKLSKLEGRPFGPVNASLYKSATEAQPDSGNARQITFLADLYLENYAETESEKTLSQKRARLSVLVDVIGPETDISEVSAEMIIEAKNSVLPYLPRRPTKVTAGLSANDRVEFSKKHNLSKISLKTQGLYLSEWKTFFSSEPVEKLVPRSPCRKLFVKGSRTKTKVREGFSASELKSIFSSPIYVGFEGTTPGAWKRPGQIVIKNEKYWVPLVGLFSGMTLAEICELRTTNIYKTQGIDVMAVTPDAAFNKTVKNEHREREVPIHPKLIELGFLGYVADQSPGPIFPALHMKAVDPSSAFGKWFNMFRKSVGADRETGIKVSFHSFRHTFREACRESGVHDYYAKRIGGWSSGDDQQSAYGTNDIVTLHDQIKRVRFSGLNLNHLL